MAIVYQLGPFYFQRVDLTLNAPFFHMGDTVEQNAPYRTGRCVIVHFPLGRGLVIGRWTGRHESEDSALMAGMQAREDELVDENGKILDRYKVRQDARRTVAKNSRGIEEEWEIINALALLEDDRDDFECADDDDADDCDCGDEDGPGIEGDLLDLDTDEDGEKS